MSNKLNDLHPQSDYDRNANLKETAGGQVEYGHLRSRKAKPTEMAISVSSYKRMLADPKRLQVAIREAGPLQVAGWLANGQ
ncbi:hypothetical protein [Limosilactobacillus mucosae]|uniref:hypothetical protein n=1 Tax=Limosilactobacillus mucosae TaxID=97478 RepID=UPI0022DEEFBE|nr:hypothetical protein [Limosilactobacillus mucosae]